MVQVQLTPDEVAAVVMARRGGRAGPPVLTAVTVGLWLVAAVWTAVLFIGIGSPSRLSFEGNPSQRVRDNGSPPVESLPPGYREPTQSEADERMFTLADRKKTAVMWWAVHQIAGVAATMLAALLSTFALVVVSRRATLEQIRAVLADISVQLDALNRAAKAPPAG